MQTNDLETAVARLVGVARARTFREPDPGAWTARQIVAHVAALNRLLAITAAHLATGQVVEFDSRAVQHEPYLAALIASARTWDGLLALLEASTHELVDTLGAIGPEEAEKPIVSRIRDRTAVMVDAVVPFRRLVAAHARFHITTHRLQLQALAAEEREPAGAERSATRA